MNDFDRTARRGAKLEAEGLKQLLYPDTVATLKQYRWLETQSASEDGKRELRSDQVMELIDEEGAIAPHALIVEFFTEPAGEALARVMEYQGRFMQELRHGPGGRDQYVFLPGMVFLTGAPPRVSLSVTVPGMKTPICRYVPGVVDFSAMDALAFLEAIEQNRLPRGLLVWVPLMRGGQTAEVVKRWRALAEQDARVATMVDLALVFARLTDSVEVWKTGLEGVVLKVSPYMEEVRNEGRAEARVQTQRQNTLEVLEVHFPGAVPAAVVKRIEAETDLARLQKWFRLALKADLAAIQADMA